MKPAMTHTKLALYYLKEAGLTGIHSFDLNRLIGSTRAAARIQDLKDQGYSIASRLERRGRSWGKRYFFIGKANQTKRVAEYKFDPGRQVFVYG